MNPPERIVTVCTQCWAVGRELGERLVARARTWFSGDQRQVGQGGHARQGHGRIVAARRGVERLGRDLQADEDQDREDDRLGDQVEDPVEVAEDPRRADEQGRRQRVAGAGPHRLVGGVADVRGRLDHAAEQAADERGDPFGGDDLAGRIVVAGRRGALGAVDPADDRRQGQRDRHRQVAERLAPVAREPLSHSLDRHRQDEPEPPGGRSPLRAEARAEPGEVHHVIDEHPTITAADAPGTAAAAPSAPSG